MPLHINFCYRKAERKKKKGVNFRFSNKYVSTCNTGTNKAHASRYLVSSLRAGKNSSPNPPHTLTLPAQPILQICWDTGNSFLPFSQRSDAGQFWKDLVRQTLLFSSITDKMVISCQHIFFLCCYSDSLFLKLQEYFIIKTTQQQESFHLSSLLFSNVLA